MSNESQLNLDPNTLRFSDEARDRGRGWVANSWLDIEFDIERAPDARPDAGDDSERPAYRLFGTSPRGTKIEIGVMWKRTSRNSGNPYLSLLINDTGVPGRPSFAGLTGSPVSPDTDLWLTIYVPRNREPGQS